MEAIWDAAAENTSGTSETSSPPQAGPALFQAGLPRFPIIDNRNDPILDTIVAMAASICEVPVAAINLISQEQQKFKAVFGISIDTPPLEQCFCRQTILDDDIFIVSDDDIHSALNGEPASQPSTFYKFYAGLKLTSSCGTIFGTLLILDKHPRHLQSQQIKELRRLARLASSHMEMQILYQEQQHKEQLNQLIIENALDYAIITTSLSGKITSWNAGAKKLFGWNAAEILNQSVDILFTPQERDKNIPEIRRINALHHQQDTVERWHIRKDGSLFWASGQLLPLYDNDGQIQGFLKILIDRTFARDQQEKLREHEEMLRLSQEAGGIGVFDFDFITHTLTVTDQIKRIYGIDPNVSISIELFEKLAGTDDAGKPNLIRTLADTVTARPFTQQTDHREYRIRRLDNHQECWVARSTELLSDEKGKIIRMRGVIQDITARKNAEQQQAVLTEELAHRSKNILAVIQGIANQTLRSTTGAEEARAAFEARIMALSKAQDVLTHGASSANAQLSEITANSLSIHVGADKARVHIEGPPVTLGSKQALSMVMALHELGTNAVKYGALSNADGSIEIQWHFANDRFVFCWKERGGPPVNKPTRRGFGSRLIERTLAASLGGTAELQYLPEGLVFRLDAPANMSKC
ncbi:sensor histidine kinase [Pseudochrobactrum sp. MP213Fo]|uniref:sensor histidine kinase n=1 Tax=Pseudochrobactrum sp. MP213Fo TaxID=3022250 RepID=UPI003B9F54FA